MSTQFKCETLIWPIDKTLSGATTLGQCGPGSDGNEGILRIPQSSSITGASPVDGLVLYPVYSLRESYVSAEMQSVYSVASANWVSMLWETRKCIKQNIVLKRTQIRIII